MVSIHDSESNVIMLVTSHHISSLRASSPGLSGGGGGKRKESMQLHLFPCGSPLTELSDFHPSVRSGNECEKTLKKTRAKGNDIISNVVFANQYFALTFSMLIFKFQRPSSKLSFFFLPCCQSTPKSLLACYHVSY